MRITIIVADSFCSIDGVGYFGLDMSSLPANVHAMQWYDVEGWIEFDIAADGIKPPNQHITDLTEFQGVIAAWEAADYNEKHPPAPPPPTAEYNVFHASQLLAATDWSQLPDVQLANKQKFDAYRAEVRQYIITPTAGFVNWPTKPTAVWV